MSRTPVSNTQPSPSAQTIVCLANPRKYSGFCIAGKEVLGLNDRIPLELAEKKLSSSLPDDLCITVD